MCECYFYVQVSESGDKTIQAMCIECYKKDPQGWYFNGEFGHKKNVICYKCKNIIRKYKEN